MIIYKNDFFYLISSEGKLFITVHRTGYNIKDFNGVLIDLPVIHLTYFKALMNALKQASEEKVHIGYLRPRIEIFVSDDELEAKMILNISAKEMENNKIGISTEIIEALNIYNITEGMDNNLFSKPLTVHKKITIALAVPPIDGDNAKITYYTPYDKRPLVKENGCMDTNLKGNVKKGEWLGEKIPPADGIPGKTVTGKLIPAKKGIDKSLKYDEKTVGAYSENGKIVLRALIDGVVKFENGTIKVEID